MITRTIAILGLGRVGASVGLGLKASTLDVKIVGYDEDREVLKQAQELGAVDETRWRLVRAVSDADIIVLALPSSAVRGTLTAIAPDVKEHTLIIDFSAQKSASQKASDETLQLGHFVGAVPVLAADALSTGTRGIAGARADLLQNSVICLMPSPNADPKAVETAVNFGTLLGAKPFFVDAAEYDSLVQGVETIPGLLALALFRATTDATGWRDMLRFANDSFSLATAPLHDDAEIAQLALQDKAATLRWLDSVLGQMNEVRQLVAEGDRDRLLAVLEQARLERERWLRERAENDWDESVEPDFTPLSFTEHLIGRHGGTEKP